jgi:peptidoglycan/LPS O-acetylase OafA/YrhL
VETARLSQDAVAVLRPGAGHPRFALFDGLRAMAAVMVLAAHVAALDAPPHGSFGRATTPLGSQGVCIFFLISGFLLYRPYVAARVLGRTRPVLAGFWRRRVLRIVPAYWFALTALGLYPGISDLFTSRWWIYYGFGQTYTRQTAYHGLGPAWSLAVEVTFYASLPALAWLADRWWRAGHRRREAVVLAVAAAASLVVHSALAIELDTRFLANLLWGTFAWFAAGMGLALLSVHVEARGRLPGVLGALAHRPGLCWLLAGASFFTTAMLLGIPAARADLVDMGFAQALAQQILFTVTAALVLIPAVFPRGSGAPSRVLRHPVVAWVGLVSYGVFLWHYSIAAWFSQSGIVLDGPLPKLPALMLTTLGASIVMGAISFYIVELPFLRLKRRRRAEPAVVEPVVEAAYPSR